MNLERKIRSDKVQTAIAIKMASEWATQVWKDSIPKWNDREQDINYRKYVIRPALASFVNSLPFEYGKYCDIGCGDGTETQVMRELLASNKGELWRMSVLCSITGYDPRPELIDKAISQAKEPKKIIFLSGKDRELRKRQHDNDLMTSMFVLQDLPDPREHLKTAYDILKRGGNYLFVLVHPEFAEKMREKGALKINESLNPETFGVKLPWKFAASYPIVKDEGPNFDTPYFHRTEEQYIELFKEYFREVKTLGLQLDSANQLFPVKESLEKRMIPPFCPFDQNVYYPEIMGMDSSLVIYGKK